MKYNPIDIFLELLKQQIIYQTYKQDDLNFLTFGEFELSTGIGEDETIYLSIAHLFHNIRNELIISENGLMTNPDIFSNAILEKFDMEIFEFFYLIRDYCNTYGLSNTQFMLLENTKKESCKTFMKKKTIN